MACETSIRRPVPRAVKVVLAAVLFGGCVFTHSTKFDNALSGDAFVEKLGMDFVYIGAGTFTMGSPTDEPGRADDEEQHRVTLGKGFYMQTTEVTRGQWEAVMGGDPSYFKARGDNCPVEQVSWNDVQAFISRLKQRTGQRYRLPTEAEWEYACRAGSVTAFANGEIRETGCADDPNLQVMGWYCANADGRAHPVAQKQANAWGLYDMHGNVWEWCQDHCDYGDGVVVDTYGRNIVDPMCSKGKGRIFRGGCFLDDARNCRSANRGGGTPDYRNARLGFRLVRN